MKEKFKTYIPLFLMVLAGVVMGYTLTALAPAEKELSLPVQLPVKSVGKFQVYETPQSLPDIELFGIDGDTAQLNNLTGKWRLVNFWATWCAPCIAELPLLLELKESRVDKDFDVIFVSLDFPENINFLKDRMKSVKTPDGFHTFYVKDLNIWETLSIQGVPTSVLVDPKGKVHFKVAGDVDWMEKETLAFIDDLLDN